MTENMRHAIAVAHTHGTDPRVLVRQHINIVVPVSAMSVAPEKPATENIRLVNVR